MQRETGLDGESWVRSQPAVACFYDAITDLQRLIRKTLGLISAKKSGGDAATGDVIAACPSDSGPTFCGILRSRVNPGHMSRTACFCSFCSIGEKLIDQPSRQLAQLYRKPRQHWINLEAFQQPPIPKSRCKAPLSIVYSIKLILSPIKPKPSFEVFFDCHVSPRVGWEQAFLKQMQRKGQKPRT